MNKDGKQNSATGLYSYFSTSTSDNTNSERQDRPPSRDDGKKYLRRGLALLPNCYIERVLTESVDHAGRTGSGSPESSSSRRATTTRAIGVEGTLECASAALPQQEKEAAPGTTTNAKKKVIRVYAPIIVSSGGSLHTPALLLRSKFQHPKIGRHLALHPVVAVAGIFPEVDTGVYKGVSMGVGEYKNQTSIDPRYGFLHPS